MPTLLARYPGTHDDPRDLLVYQDKVIFGDFVHNCPAGYNFIDATVFNPGYKGMNKENMTILYVDNFGVIAELHIEIE